MRGGFLAPLALLLALPACLTDGDVGERSALSELNEAADSSGVPLKDSVSLLRERYRWASEDWTAGHIEQIEPDYVVLTPFMGAVGTVRMLIEPQTAVFEGNARIPIEQMPPNSDVRVNYRGKSGEARVVSIELLTPTQVASLQRP